MLKFQRKDEFIRTWVGSELHKDLIENISKRSKHINVQVFGCFLIVSKDEFLKKIRDEEFQVEKVKVCLHELSGNLHLYLFEGTV